MMANKSFSSLDMSRAHIFLLIYLVILIFSSCLVLSETVTTFNEGEESISLTFDGSPDEKDFFIEIPKSNILSASLSITGLWVPNSYNTEADVVLVTDVSGSMNWTISSSSTVKKLDAAKEADKIFVDMMDPEYVNIGLSSYSNCPSAVNTLPMTDQYDLVYNRIDKYIAKGGTNIGRGLKFAIDNIIINGRDIENKAIILMTDGVANYYDNATHSCIDDKSSGDMYAKNYVLDQAIRAKENGIKIYAVGFGSDADKILLEQVGSLSNGGFYYAPSNEKLNEIYKEIAGIITEQSYPTPIISSDAWRVDEGELTTNANWFNSECGYPKATCNNLKSYIQSQLVSCDEDLCKVYFSVGSKTPGIVELSDLKVEYEPFPKLSCVQVPPEYIITDRSEHTFDIDSVFDIPDEETDVISLTSDSDPSLVRFEPYLPESFNITVLSNFDREIIELTITSITSEGSETLQCPIYVSYEPDFVISCAEVVPMRYVSEVPVSISFEDVFDFSGEIEPISSFYSSTNPDVELTPYVASSNFDAKLLMDFSGTSRSYVSLQSVSGYQSEECPVDFRVQGDTDDPEINCKDLGILVLQGTRTIDLDRIFDIPSEAGQPVNLIIQSDYDYVKIQSSLPDTVSFSSTDKAFVRESPRIRIITSLGLSSPYCPVDLIRVEPRCNTDICRGHIDDLDLSALVSDGCLDGSIEDVYDFKKFYPYSELSGLDGLSYSMDDAFVIPDGSFFVSYNQADKSYVLNKGDVSDDGFGILVMDVGLGYGLSSVRYCYRISPSSFEEPDITDVQSELLVTSSAMVPGYYDYTNPTSGYPSLIYTVKVWIRK